MLLSHAHTLALARSSLAALADQAATIDASSAYERVLIELDRVHGDQSPATDNTGRREGPEILLAVATAAVEDLERHGVDRLTVELILAMVADAADLDVT
ncbi:MAG: hypothetical protein R2734_16720 [Nocardioides sp.]